MWASRLKGGLTLVLALALAGCGGEASPDAAAPTVAPPVRATTAAPTTVAPAAAAPTTAPATNVSPTIAAPAAAPPASAPATAGASTAPPAGNVVEVGVLDNIFEPRAIMVAPGTTIRWINRGGADHDVSSTDLKTFLSPVLKTGQTFEATLVQAGMFAYVCSLHEGMSGSVVVR